MCIAGHPPRLGHLAHTSSSNPNSFAPEDLEDWIGYFDIYQNAVFPHLLTFDSWSHALELLRSTDLFQVAQSMRKHNIKEFSRLSELWHEIFLEVETLRGRDVPVADTADEANSLIYGIPRDGADICDSCTSRSGEQVEDINSQPKCGESVRFMKKQPLNPVTTGSYLTKCLNAAYDPDDDVLQCKLDDKLLKMRNPFACASDIWITPTLELQC